MIDKSDNLKSLISSSNILSPGEKAEWSALLELMNDKQMGELEKILTSAKQPAPVTEAKQPIAAVARQDNKFSDTGKRMPQLSHIMNIPKHVASIPMAAAHKEKAEPVLSNRVAPSPVISSQTLAAKKTFTDKLKGMFAEKELPAPKEENLLPKGHPPMFVVKPAAPVTAPLKPLVDKPVIAAAIKPAPPVVPVPKLAVNPAVLKPQPPAVKPVLPVVGYSKPAMPQAQAKGLNFTQVNEQVRNETLAAVKQNLQNKPEINLQPVASPAVAGKTPEIRELKDLVALSPEVLDESDLNALSGKIKGLLNRYNYHEVMFNLEQSQAYQAYINTGLELLKKQISFDQASQQGTQPGMMDRDQFEKFVDLIRKIQAA